MERVLSSGGSQQNIHCHITWTYSFLRPWFLSQRRRQKLLFLLSSFYQTTNLLHVFFLHFLLRRVGYNFHCCLCHHHRHTMISLALSSSPPPPPPLKCWKAEGVDIWKHLLLIIAFIWLSPLYQSSLCLDWNEIANRSSQPSMVDWLNGPIFPCSLFVCLSRYGDRFSSFFSFFFFSSSFSCSDLACLCFFAAFSF